MPISLARGEEILETTRMVQMENLDIRTITMGISLRDCACSDIEKTCQKIYDKITKYAENLVAVGNEIEKEYGIPIINKRISVTPIGIVAESANVTIMYKLPGYWIKQRGEVGVNF